MADLQGKYQGNISLPPRLQSPDMKNCTVKDLDAQPTIINMQRAMYKSLINDLEQKIERLQTRNEKLKEFFDYVNDYSINDSVETEKVLVELHTNIAFETKKVNELKLKYAEVEKMRQSRISDHEDKVNRIKEKFDETSRRLSSKIKLLSAQINSLEDFKSSKEALTMKLNSKNAFIVRKEEELQQTLKDFEFKAKVHRENLKKETYKKVLDTSNNFQSDLRSTIPLNVQRMLRENVILENELVQCWTDHANITDHKVNCENNVQHFYERVKEAKLRIKPRLVTSKIQKLLIERLKKAHSMIKKELSKSFEAPDDFEEKYQKILDSINKSEFTGDDFIRRKLEVVLHQERIKLALANQFKSKTSFALNACCDALGIIKYAVNTAVSGEGEIIDIESFASYLLNVIEDCNSRKWIAPSESLETVEFPSNVYLKGDLGFEPKHIQIEDQLIEKTDQISSRSIMSTLEILQELEKLQEKIITEEKCINQTHSQASVSTDASTITQTEKSESTVDSAADKQREEKLRLFYEEIFGDESNLEYEMEDEYDDYLNYEQE